MTLRQDDDAAGFQKWRTNPVTLDRHQRPRRLRKNSIDARLDRSDYAGSGRDHTANAAACPWQMPFASTRFHTTAGPMRKRRPRALMRTPA